MGWLRALLGQKLRSLSRSFAALFILSVARACVIQDPSLARGVLAEIRSHYALVSNSIQAQECRSIDTTTAMKVELLEDYKRVRETSLPIITNYALVYQLSHAVLESQVTPAGCHIWLPKRGDVNYYQRGFFCGGRSPSGSSAFSFALRVRSRHKWAMLSP